jgi:hypothetical protein
MLLKSDRWWSWKIPPMLAFGYFGLLSGPLTPSAAQLAGQIALFLIAAIGIAAFGHLFTDIFDVAEDRIRGQANLWADSGRLQRWPLLVVLLAASWIPWFFIPIGRLGMMLVAAEFLMFGLYAVPPIRLKNRGLAGLAADGMYAHALPALWTWIPFAHLSGAATPPLIALAIGAWGISVGVRELMHHQAIDVERDREAGATTFGVRRGSRHLMGLLRGVVLPAEMIALVVLLGVMARVSIVPIAGFAVYITWSVIKVRALWLEPVALIPPDTDDGATVLARRVLGPFYYGWLPLLLLAALVINDPVYLVAAALHMLLFGRMIMRVLIREASLLLSFVTRQRRPRMVVAPSRIP